MALAGKNELARSRGCARDVRCDGANDAALQDILSPDLRQELDDVTLLGITLLVAILTLLGNLLADVALGLVNPRIRIEGNAR